MIYIDSNERLASLIEKLANSTATKTDITDAEDLVSSLRSERKEINLLTRESLNRKFREFNLREKQ